MNAAAGATEAAALSPHGIAVLAFAALVIAVFIWDHLPISTVCLAVLAALPLGFVLAPLPLAQGMLDPTRFFAGFAHPALVAICSLMAVGQALVVTGALEPAARRLAALFDASPKLALLAVLAAAAGASGLVNDTPVVVLLIPLLIAAAARAKVAAGKLLLPMNYAVLIGGMATTIGTSTNLIVVALAAGLGVGPFSMFSFYPLVMMAAVPALLYLWLLAPRLLAGVPAPSEQFIAPVFNAELTVEPDSWLDGRELHEAIEATGDRMRVLELKRAGGSVARLPSLALRAGDRLLLQDTVEHLKEFETTLKAKLHGDHFDPQAAAAKSGSSEADDDKPEEPASTFVAQMIVTPQSPLVGRTVHERRLGDHYGIVVVGLRPRHAGRGFQHGQLADRRLHSGDILLVQGDAAAVQMAQRDGMGLLLDERFALPRQEKANLALLTMAAVVLLAATKTVPIELAALAGVIFLLASRCLSWDDVTQSLSVKVVLLVAASLALGDALEVTGATAFLALQLAGVSQGLPPAAVLALLMGLMGLLTNFVSNNAAAAVGTPLGIELALLLGVPPEPFVLAVLFGCNLCYLTPMGYQTNLLVMNAGGYRFLDFGRVGAPLFLIMWAGLSYGLMLRYGL